MRELSPYSSQQSRWRGGAAFWVGVRVSQRLYNHHSRDEGLVREKVPTWWLNCRCPSARRGGVGVEVRGASSQRWLCRVPPVGVGVVRCVSPTAASGTSTPAPDWFVPRSSPKLPLLVPSGAGRGLKVCSSCRRCVLRASNGFSANDGGDAVGEAAQNRARRFGAKRVCPESAAFGFPPLAGVAPDPMRRGQFRAQPTACPAWSAPRAAYAYRLRLFSPDGENRSPRWGRLRDTTTDDNGTRGGAVGCCWRVARHFAKAGSAAKPQTQRPRQNGGLGGTWRCVCNAGKPCGPKRSADGRGISAFSAPEGGLHNGRILYQNQRAPRISRTA